MPQKAAGTLFRGGEWHVSGNIRGKRDEQGEEDAPNRAAQVGPDAES